MTREQSIRKGSTKAKPRRLTNRKSVDRSAQTPTREAYEAQVAAFCATACPMQKRYVIGLKAGLALLHEMQQAGALRLPFAAYSETVELMRWALEQAPGE